MKHQVVIAGSGLSALTAACRLITRGVKDIALYAPAYGGTPFIAAINFVLTGNPYHDTQSCYTDDMIRAGFGLNDPELVRAMVSHSEETCNFLTSLGIEFSRLADGSLRRRHLSGSTYPRSLCSTNGLIGAEMIEKLTACLKKNGVELYSGYKAVALSSRGNRIDAMEFVDKAGKTLIAEADTFIAAWGGVGNLFGTSTYPVDENGRSLAVAYEAGVKLIDLEFLEYEPMVVMNPPGAAGEPCPTAMLGEGAQLLNTKFERFILETRPQGEAGAPKTLINRAIWQQVQKGFGTTHGGCWVDLRHIPVETLKLYPWFYNRLTENGLDPHVSLVEVGPMAHSFSGGIKVDTSCRSNFGNLYAAGEAAGGFHGACRMAGNAASQAAVSGFIAADAIAADAIAAETGNGSVSHPVDKLPEYRTDEKVRKNLTPRIDSAAVALGVYRNGKVLENSRDELVSILEDQIIEQDTDTKLRAESIWLMVCAALKRTESRGTHNRTDYPEQDESQNHSNIFYKEG